MMIRITARARAMRLLSPAAATALALAAVVALAGCTSPSTDRPTLPTGASGTQTPDTRSGSQGTGLIPPDGQTGTTVSGTAGTAPTGPPATPDAATLQWLAGAQTDDGLLLPAATGQRWQGTVPGEYALIGDDGYRWFGAGGAMVGCAVTGACVAIDEQGRVAVTTGRDSPRLVYDTSGIFVGRFAADGTPMSPPADPPDLPHALVGSGVDVPGLVNAATLSVPFAGGATGDPHLISAGGVRFTTQVAGQFVARTGDPTHTVQLEFQPMAHRSDVSVVSGVAIGTGENTVVVEMAGTLTIDGAIRPRQPEFQQIQLSAGVVVGRWPADAHRVVTVAVAWPDGGSVLITANPALGITVVAHLPVVTDATGLFGTSDKASGSDLASRQGDSGETAAAVASWAVRGSERLFQSPPEPNPGFPTKEPTIDSAARQMGTGACAAQGLQQADATACAFDVALTGDPGFVAGHVALAAAAGDGRIAAAFAQRWPALVSDLPAPIPAPALPPDGEVDFLLAPAASQAFRVQLERAGVVTLVNRAGCATGESPPGLDQPAMRLFDLAGNPVSDRFALCGHEQTPELAPGSYTLVIGNGRSSAQLPVRIDVGIGSG